MLRLVVFFFLSRGVVVVVPVALSITGLCGWLIPDTVGVPLWPLETVQRVSSFVGFIIALAWCESFEISLGGAEGLGHRRVRLLRLGWYLAGVGLLSGLTASAVGSSWAPGEQLGAIANGWWYLGLISISTVVAPPLPNWLIPLVVAVATFFFGLEPGTDDARWWALPLWHDDRLPWRVLVAVVVSVVGGALAVTGRASASATT